MNGPEPASDRRRRRQQFNFIRAFRKVSLRRKSIRRAAALKARGKISPRNPTPAAAARSELHRQTLLRGRRGDFFLSFLPLFFPPRVHAATGHLELSPTCSCASLVIRPALTLVRAHRDALCHSFPRARRDMSSSIVLAAAAEQILQCERALRVRGGRPWE